ncbi:hypothetical protein G9F32_08810 [Acinetobacter sp. 194]|uniref:hypothetical protein n=1 Tax=Acinetobacter shaoyimingii TaxID=2715164 RepID=UPI00140D55B8|nr:hypothetical protein [Acinetobacter shaoyimingii]NHB58119.1 hypothetical protein [Acinetobacter shaoyimingii]
MSRIFYLSQQQLYCFDQTKSISIPCQAIDQYKKNLAEIKQRKQWKSQGAGAQFMGLNGAEAELDLSDISLTDVVYLDDKNVVYSAHLQGGTAIQMKPIDQLNDPEGLVLRKNEFVVDSMHIDPVNRRLVLSASQEYQVERHLCILALDANRTQFITEGESLDSNPFFNPLNTDEIYYDSCGLSYTYDVTLGPKEINKLNMTNGDLETIISDPKFDFFKPQMDRAGNLFFIQRPYNSAFYKEDFFSFLKNILLAPVKIIKAIVGWLDFFTQRYTGESLKRTSGANPAKARQKTEEELFVEGNLIKAQQTLEKNKQAGEKFPGVIPETWKLIKLTPSGEQVTVKKGVMSFVLKDGRILYSNGQHLLELDAEGNETLLLEARLISKII